MGIVQDVAALIADVAGLKAAVGSHQKLPEARWGTVTTYAPGDIRVTFLGESGECAITRSTEQLSVGDIVMVQVQGNDRWVVGRANGSRPANVAFYAVQADFTDVDASAGLGFDEVSFTPKVGRLYQVTWCPPLSYCTTAVAIAEVAMRCTTDGSRPTVASGPKIRLKQYPLPQVGYFTDTPALSQLFSVSSTPAYPWRFLGTLIRVGGSGTLMTRNDSLAISPYWLIEDLGPVSAIAGNTLVTNNGL